VKQVKGMIHISHLLQLTFSITTRSDCSNWTIAPFSWTRIWL